MTVAELIEKAKNHKPTQEQHKAFFERVKKAEERYQEKEMQKTKGFHEALNRYYTI